MKFASIKPVIPPYKAELKPPPLPGKAPVLEFAILKPALMFVPPRVDDNSTTLTGQSSTVNTFNYLGKVLSSGSSFIHATQTLAGKALRAMSSLFRITKPMEVPVNVNFDLFDTYVASSLSYGCEVRGFSKSDY